MCLINVTVSAQYIVFFLLLSDGLVLNTNSIKIIGAFVSFVA